MAFFDIAKDKLMDGKGDLLELNAYTQLGEWLDNAINNSDNIPNKLIVEWNSIVAPKKMELEKTREEIEKFQLEPKSYSGLFNKVGTISKLKAKEVSIKASLYKSNTEVGKIVFACRDEITDSHVASIFNTIDSIVLDSEERSVAAIKRKEEEAMMPDEFIVGGAFGMAPTIQKAIDNASDNSVIFISNGTYSEDLIITKKIHFKPFKPSFTNQGNGEVTIDGRVVIKANVNISQISFTSSKGTAIELVGDVDVLIDACNISHTKFNAIKFNGLNITNPLGKLTILNSNIYHTSHTYPAVSAMCHSKIVLKDCKIHDIPHIGLFITDQAEIKVENCEIWEIVNDVICVKGEGSRAMLINGEIHHIHSELTSLVDNGVVETKGTVINPIYENSSLEGAITKATPKKISKPCDANTKSTESNKVVSDVLNILNSMIGLNNVKNEIEKITSFITIREIKRSKGMQVTPASMHLVFTGNPGTGKTTVGRILGQTFKELGLLKRGHFIEVSRNDLVGQYQGHTADKTTTILRKALGGVLFIDEVYSLVNGDGDDFGREAINTIVPFMENHRNEFILIVAGYTDTLDIFLDKNTGLKSRFNYTIEFEDYSNVQLYDIFEIFAHKFFWDKKTTNIIKKILKNLVKNKCKHFGNAREVRKIFETIKQNQSNRLVAKLDHLYKDDPSLFEIKHNDLDMKL